MGVQAAPLGGAVVLSRQTFKRLVEEAIRSLPPPFLARLRNVDVVVEEQPTAQELSAAGVEPPDTLLGLYTGVPLTERGSWYGNVLPDKITLYQRPIQALCRSRQELRQRVREVLMHEVGHHFGLTDRELEEVESS